MLSLLVQGPALEHALYFVAVSFSIPRSEKLLGFGYYIANIKKRRQVKTSEMAQWGKVSPPKYE